MNVIDIGRMVNGNARHFPARRVGIGKVRNRHDDADAMRVLHDLEGIFAINEIDHPLSRIALVSCDLIVESRPAWAHGELKRPEVSLLIDHAADVTETDVVELMQ